MMIFMRSIIMPEIMKMVRHSNPHYYNPGDNDFELSDFQIFNLLLPGHIKRGDIIIRIDSYNCILTADINCCES
jgi:hypothetical protein